MPTRPRPRTTRPVHRHRRSLAAGLAVGALLLAGVGAPGVPPAVAATDGLLMERLDRAPVAVAVADGVYLGWRQLGLDPASIRYEVFRDGRLITPEPISDSTNLVDPAGTATSTYRIRAVGAGRANGWITETFGVRSSAALDIPIDRPAGGTTPDGVAYTYNANDASVGDLDGDGQYEIVLKWDPSNAKDNSQSGHTGNVYLDAYELDGTRLWRIDLGRNIRAGAHYSQPMVYDLDSDGLAEVVVKTADGTVDGRGVVIGDADADFRNEAGYVLDGPEFLTVFDGRDGSARDTVPYDPPRGEVDSWGDDYGNRVDRFLAGVAYLDGRHPSVIVSRGYYTRTVVAAYDLTGDGLAQRWLFDSDVAGEEYEGQGNHQLAVADVDTDGRDEIVFGAMTLDDDGSVLYNTGLGHGDALHVSDFDPNRPGLEVFSAHESMTASGNRGATFRSAATGEVYWAIAATRDTGRAAMADIDPTRPGAEGWATGGSAEAPSPEMRGADGRLLARTVPAANFVTWWDGDLTREITDHTYDADLGAGVPTVGRWDPAAGTVTPLLTATGTYTNNGTKGTPALQADLLGDWREELLYRTIDSSALRLYTTTTPTSHRIPTLMHDPTYRLAVAWQNVAYNQPPHPGFHIGESMPAVTRPYRIDYAG